MSRRTRGLTRSLGPATTLNGRPKSASPEVFRMDMAARRMREHSARIFAKTFMAALPPRRHEARFGDHHVHAFVAGDRRSDVQIRCDAREHVRIVARKMFLGDQEVDHFS